MTITGTVSSPGQVADSIASALASTGTGRRKLRALPGWTRPDDSAAFVPISVTGEPTSKIRRYGPRLPR